jgi:hypothetical protein
MNNPPSTLALRDALLSVQASHPTITEAALQTTLRELVYTVVDEMKAAKWPPERVIVAIKLIVNDAGLRASYGVLASDADLSEVDAVLLNVFGWCLERYFGPELSLRSRE